MPPSPSLLLSPDVAQKYAGHLNRLKNALLPPRHSEFRVGCLVRFQFKSCEQTAANGVANGSSSGNGNGTAAGPSSSSSTTAKRRKLDSESDLLKAESVSTLTESIDFPKLYVSDPYSKPGSDSDSDSLLLFGANVESANLCGGVCAERTALSQLRLVEDFESQKSSKQNCTVTSTTKVSIQQLFILTDAFDFISPGAMCREYLSEHFNLWREDVPIYLFCVNDNESDGLNSFRVRIHCIRDMWPYPSIYRWKWRHEMAEYGCEVAKKPLTRTGGLNGESTDNVNSVIQLIDPRFQALYKACLEEIQVWKKQLDPANINKTYGAPKPLVQCHPILYVAGIEIFSSKDGTERTLKTYLARQTQSMEFPCSVDAVSKLFTHLEMDLVEMEESLSDQNNVEYRLRLLHIDQFGLCHAPFAPARAYLVENGYSERMETVVQDSVETKKNVVVKVGRLYESVPVIESLGK